MVTPGPFAVRLAGILEIPPATIIVYDRSLRDAGLLEKGGRGTSATNRTSLEAARLIIAIMATSSPKLSAGRAKAYGGLVLDPEYERMFAKDFPITLEYLCGDRFAHTHTFDDAVSALIARVGRDDYIPLLVHNLDPNHSPEFFRHSTQTGANRLIVIKVFKERLTASICIGPNEYSYFPAQIVAMRDCNREEQVAQAPEYWKQDVRFSGLRTISYITDHELDSVSRLLAS